MKKYLLGLFAVVLAVGFSAFTTPKTTTVFKYQLTTFSPSLVQSVAATSWLPGTVSCNSIDVKACSIEVDDIYTHTDGQGRKVLNDASFANHITIVAAGTSSNIYVDPAASTNIATVSNKQ